jgi:hypothetical protein
MSTLVPWACRADRAQLAAAFLDTLMLSGQLLAEFKHIVRASHSPAAAEAHQSLLTLLD